MVTEGDCPHEAYSLGKETMVAKKVPLHSAPRVSYRKIIPRQIGVNCLWVWGKVTLIKDGCYKTKKQKENKKVTKVDEDVKKVECIVHHCRWEC